MTNFRIRMQLAEALGRLNGWFCSELHHRDIRDPENLWNYYVDHFPSGSGKNDAQNEPDEAEAELSVACQVA